MNVNEMWVVGAGQMTQDYLKVLNFNGISPIVIGRGKENCKIIENNFQCTVFPSGLSTFLKTRPNKPKKVIVAVGIEALQKVALELIDYGIDDILLEKPGIAYISEVEELAYVCKTNNVKISLAYNRRFYASLLKAEDFITEDGGISSFNFEFTEWSHTIKTLNKTKQEWHNWFLGNSTHVVDTAFFLGGKPKELSAYFAGSLDWHPSSSKFCGAGVTETGALFSYHADWEAPGRWVIEILTKKRRLIFKPMETLQVQLLGSVAVNPVELDDHLDKDFKPGLYLQTKAFLENDYTRFCTIHEQKEMIENVYNKISGYKN